METFLENFGQILMGMASLLPTFPPSWNAHFCSYPTFHCIISLSQLKIVQNTVFKTNRLKVFHWKIWCKILSRNWYYLIAWNWNVHLKFIYSEKATKFCEISTVDLTVTTLDKSTVEILQNFVAFSEYMNFCFKCTFQFHAIK